MSIAGLAFSGLRELICRRFIRHCLKPARSRGVNSAAPVIICCQSREKGKTSPVSRTNRTRFIVIPIRFESSLIVTLCFLMSWQICLPVNPGNSGSCKTGQGFQGWACVCDCWCMVKPFLFREEREAERDPREFSPGGCVRESDGNVFRRKPADCRFCQPNSVLGDHDFPCHF